jgi:hypothetical protein
MVFGVGGGEGVAQTLILALSGYDRRTEVRRRRPEVVKGGAIVFFRAVMPGV